MRPTGRPPGPPTVGVVVPSFGRPDALRSCLAGLARQADRADDVVVAHRPEDTATTAILDELAVRRATVAGRGVILAMATGAASLDTDVVAFCDDDAVPRTDWVTRLQRAFTDPRVGVYGGRDELAPPHPRYAPSRSVGEIGRWGRVSGNHHCGAIGAAREVDVLKAVNMAFRSDALRFPSHLRGAGAQVHFELPMCMWARAQGWSVVFDPDLVVDHDPRDRFDADQRDRPAAEALAMVRTT